MADYDVTSFDVENTFSSWLDGTLSPEEEAAFMIFCASTPEMQEIMEANDQLDETYEALVEDGYELPAEMMDDFIFPQVENNDVYSYDELSNVEDADNDNYDLSAHGSDGGDYEQDESYDNFDLL
ncbi:hypothetical protein [Segatella hominis]|uniref:hypothetical protein n=1 Tax=Segatella hominis TaxID=2518605 RepID=UPI0003407A3F|nr:hypothetical protein [uncultured Prevotella sp.]CDA55201.1 unknown [Prevotella sp. CAG:604]